MKYKNFKLVMLISLLSSALTACTTTTSMSPEVKQTIHTINVDNNIQVAKSMYYMPPSAYLPLAFGGFIGAAITENSTEKSEEELRLKAIRNHVNIDQIIKDEFITEIQAHQTYKIINSKNSDATLIISIPEYGISIPTGFSTQVSPVLSIDAKLIKNGNIIWSYKTTNAPAMSGVPRYTMDQINSNPLLLKEMWSAEASILINEIVKTM